MSQEETKEKEKLEGIIAITKSEIKKQRWTLRLSILGLVFCVLDAYTLMINIDKNEQWFHMSLAALTAYALYRCTDHLTESIRELENSLPYSERS